MDIMMRLKGAGFSVIANEFRQREKRLGSGLPLQDFVEIVLQGLPKPKTPEEKYANISALVDLFEDMDINGDGTMEFDEFTSYCVDAGMVATRAKTANLKHRYVRNTRHVIKTTNGSLGIEKVRWSPRFQRFLVVENAAKSVKVFHADGYMVGDVRSQSTLLNAPPTEDRDVSSTGNTSSADEGGSPTRRSLRARDADATNRSGSGAPSAATATPGGAAANTGIFILDAVFLHKFQCLAMSTTDFVISFYSMEEPKHQQRLPTNMLAATARSGPSYDVLPKLTITTTTAQLLLRFCEEAGLLFSAGNDFVVNVWKIEDLETKTLWKRLIHHQDMIMDIVEIPMHDMIASCDLNHTVQLWDIHDCRSRGALMGHTRGIKQMVFSKDHDMLLTAGFEFDAYGWDIASRQVVMKLVGHRAPLIGVQLALFQTERAITADSSGVFKVWDISRATGSTTQSASAGASSRQGGRGASQAVLLESLDPTHELSRFEPTTFISLHPQRRDMWTAASGSATLHLFRSTRVQQFDEIPLKAFYHYNANRFVVVSGPVCSIWDGETGTCVDEFNHIGAFIGNARAGSGSGHQSNHSGTASTHNGAAVTPGLEASTDILLCVQDSKCKKLVMLSEEGEMGVFNCQNFVQMRRCEEKFCSVPPGLRFTHAGASGSLPPPSCGIVGLHYCSENKLVIATDSHTSSICVIDDSNNDSSKGIRDTTVLRRLINIPGGIATSAYSYHASMIAILDETTNSKVSLWDFETLVSVGSCQMEDEDADAGARMQLLTFWEEFPVLLGADSHGGVYFFAVMPTVQAKTGKLLHAFINDHTVTTVTPTPTERETDAEARDEGTTEENYKSATFITEGAESAARKFLLKRKSLQKAATSSCKSNTSIGAPGENQKGDTPQQAAAVGGVVTCMQVVLDDDDQQHRYLLFTADEKGVIRVWSLSDMMRRLSLFKIPETSCKYLRRGYHPRAMFAHDSAKQANINRSESSQEGIGLPAGDLVSDTRARLNQAHLKRLTKHRVDAKKKSTASSSQLAKILAPNRVLPGHAPPSATTVAAAEAFLVSQSSLLRSSSPMSRSSSVGGSALGDGGALIRTRGRPAENRRRSYCWQHQDVKIVNVWTAHTDGITSLEVSKHPNIVVTCSLDMRVFVWSWQGACLGKLFDAENVGPCRWRFGKDDSKRDAERKVLIDELLHELELPPQQKAHRRRQTLYLSHVQRKSQKELSHVNVMLLDHIVSQHPEVAAMEKEGLSNASTDEKINAEMERTRQRNYRAKAKMLEALARASTCTGSTHSKEVVRMHSLAQVGPLLCVDKFEMKQELQQMKFAEKDELKMDRQYLEGELGVGTSSSAMTKDGKRGSMKAGSLASIKDQIRQAQYLAKDMMENKVALQRHASAMYSNLHQTQRRTPQLARDSMLLDDTEVAIAERMELDEMLEPSPFLRSKLPDRVLSIRPQTAPCPKGTSTLTRAKSSLSVKAIPNLGFGSVEVETRKKQLRPLTATASESSLQGVVRRESITQSPSRSVSSVDSSKASRRSSLDQMYLEELQRQGRPSIKRGSQSDKVAQELTEMAQESDQAGEDTSLNKLDMINAIIHKAQDVCDASAKVPKERCEYEVPSTGTSTQSTNERDTHRQRSSVLPTLHETDDAQDEHIMIDESRKVDENELRRHLEATRRRMEIAMGHNERGGGGGSQSKRSMINKKRVEVEHQKKGRRMEDYLQQKRREMNTNIGSVFKRTSFAFPSSGAMSDGVLDTHNERAKKKNPKSGPPAAETADHRAMLEAQAQVEKSKVFGIYGVKEVMSIIRLFWSMDEDCSGTLSLAELLAYKEYFEKLGYHDMATVFQAIDKDGSGNITLKELLEICFQYATKYQIEEMLKLAKLGDVASYFDATQRQRNGSKKATISPEERDQHPHGEAKSGEQDKNKSEFVLSKEERAELLEIFRVFDRNGDGGIGMDEIMEALHVEEDDTFERVAAAEEAQLAERDAALGGSKRKPSVPGSPSRTRNSSSAFTKEEVRKFYQDVDTDGDQSLDFEEFVVLMQMLHGSRR